MNSALRSRVLKSLTSGVYAPFSSNGGLLSARLQEHPLRDAIRFENQNKTWTYKELEHHSNAFAYGLLELGYKRGDRLLLWADKAYTSEITIAQLGSAKVGVAIVPLLSSSGSDFQSALKDTDARGVILSANTKSGGQKRSEVLYEAFPELENAYSGSPTSFSNYPKLKNVIHLGFHTLPGTIKYRQLLVYANKNFTTHSLPTDVPGNTPLYYAKNNGSYKEYSLQDIESYADRFRSENGVNQDETIVVSGCPYCPGTFAAGAYQSIAHGNYVILYGNEPLKGLVEKIQVQNPNYLVINQAFDKADLTSVANQGSLDSLKKVLVSGQDTSAYQNVFGGKSVSNFNAYW
jgi:hypothetical protein